MDPQVNNQPNKQANNIVTSLKNPTVLFSVLSQIVSLLILVGVNIDENMAASIIGLVMSVMALIGIISKLDLKKAKLVAQDLYCPVDGKMSQYVEVNGQMVCVKCGHVYNPKEDSAKSKIGEVLNTVATVGVAALNVAAASGVVPTGGVIGNVVKAVTAPAASGKLNAACNTSAADVSPVVAAIGDKIQADVVSAVTNIGKRIEADAAAAAVAIGDKIETDAVTAAAAAIGNKLQ